MQLPLFNKTHMSFTRRDTLGMETLTTSMQEKYCPIIALVTPHPFYWAFLVWNYYHYYSFEENKKKGDTFFTHDYVKRNDFFFVLSNYLGKNNMAGIAGNSNVASEFRNKTDLEVFPRFDKYYKEINGGMFNYNSGCREMKFVLNKNKIRLNDGSLGAKLTEAFDYVIKETAFYKKYISKNEDFDSMTKDELIELSKCLTLRMEKMSGVQEILYEALFPKQIVKDDPCYLNGIEEYIKLLIKYGLLDKNESFNPKKARSLLYGNAQPELLNHTKVTDYQKRVITRWELIIANQYFVTSVEMIWKRLLDILVLPLTQEKWIDEAFRRSTNLNLDASLKSISEELSFDEMESKIFNKQSSETIHSALSMIMSLYNRFKNRTGDFDYIKRFKYEELRVFSLIEKINKEELKSVRDLLVYLIKHHIINGHEKVAIRKRFQGEDAYLFRRTDEGLYARRDGKETIDIGMPPLRFTNVFNVLKELGKLS